LSNKSIGTKKKKKKKKIKKTEQSWGWEKLLLQIPWREIPFLFKLKPAKVEIRI